MKYVFLLFLCVSLLGCDTDETLNLNYSTTPKVLKLYKQGWKQIMDEGRYGEAEISYRKALELDPDFVVGKSVLARLTLDLGERLKFYKEIQEEKQRIQGDERLILDVYAALVKFTNMRDQGSETYKTTLKEALQIGERNLRKIVHKYPEEIYLKAEYIEILNSIYGPRQALDSLNRLTTKAQKGNPFLLGFSANMHAELEEHELAMQKANRLLEVVNDSTLPKTYAVLAAIYFQMGNLTIAKCNADRANHLDPRNLDASRLKKKIDEALSEQENLISNDMK